MNYTKPEVAVLGEAAVVIANSTMKGGPYAEALGLMQRIAPAYDLDELVLQPIPL